MVNKYKGCNEYKSYRIVIVTGAIVVIKDNCDCKYKNNYNCNCKDNVTERKR